MHPMLKSILVASDLSSRSQPAVKRGIQLARDHQARLCVLSVVEDDLLGGRMYAEIGRIEDDLTAQTEEFGRPEGSEVIVATGHAFRVIAEEARARSADLIVMGTHRRQFLRDVFVGTTIERVTRTAGRPVLMANKPADGPWRRIFIATDLSEASANAARAAKTLGLLEDADVSFVHACAPMTRAGIPVEHTREEAEREFRTMRHELGRFVERLDLGDLNYGARIIEGIAADAIIGLVEQARPDLLVIGTRGLSGVKRLFLGSVAQELMGSVEVDVLAVPPQGWKVSSQRGLR